MRVLDFADAISSAVQPTVGGFSYVYGSRASPQLITAAGGITFNGNALEIQFIAGNGGPIDLTADPQISDGTSVGQILVLIGCHDTNTVKFDNGTGLDGNGNRTLGNDSCVAYMWDGTDWLEIFYNNI